MNYRMVINTLGWVLNFEAVCFMLPLVCSLIYGEPYVIAYLVCIAACLFGGLVLTFRQPKNRTMYAKEGYVIVALCWIVMSAAGALPFVLTGFVPDFVDALFETVSGFTTTGASILTDVEALPKSLLFWRSFTHWIGGMGVLVFLVAILPLAGGNNMYLVKAESTGPAVSKLVPKIGTSAKWLYVMYVLLTIVEFLFLLTSGIGLFDSLTLTFGTAGTGGFAIKNSGLADYSSYVQYVIGIFMLLFGIDFSVYYLLLMRKLKLAFRSDEVKTYLGIIAVATLVICFNCRGLYGSFADAFKNSFFQVSSLITTTGYSTVDYNRWSELSKTILLGLMFCGGCAGSTAGGIKVSRIMILLKSIVKEVKISVHPNRIYKTTISGSLVEHETVRAVNVFMVSYIAIYIISLLLISLDNMDFTTNFTAVAATLNNIGPGFGAVGPVSNFSAYSDLSKCVMIFNMLAGRLEIFPILILFSSNTWKK